MSLRQRWKWSDTSVMVVDGAGNCGGASDWGGIGDSEGAGDWGGIGNWGGAGDWKVTGDYGEEVLINTTEYRWITFILR